MENEVVSWSTIIIWMAESAPESDALDLVQPATAAGGSEDELDADIVNYADKLIRGEISFVACDICIICAVLTGLLRNDSRNKKLLRHDSHSKTCCHVATILFNKFLDTSDVPNATSKEALNKSQLAWLLKSIGAMDLPDGDRQKLLDEMEQADANMDSQLDFEEFLVFFNSILKVKKNFEQLL